MLHVEHFSRMGLARVVDLGMLVPKNVPRGTFVRNASVLLMLRNWGAFLGDKKWTPTNVLQLLSAKFRTFGDDVCAGIWALGRKHRQSILVSVVLGRSKAWAVPSAKI